MKYLWTEDTGAGLHFWKLVNQLFFDNELAVESKGSNQGLLDALIDLETEDGDEYFVAFDYVVDNQDMLSKKWGKYIIGDLFERIETAKLPYKADELPKQPCGGIKSGIKLLCSQRRGNNIATCNLDTI